MEQRDVSVEKKSRANTSSEMKSISLHVEIILKLAKLFLIRAYEMASCQTLAEFQIASLFIRL